MPFLTISEQQRSTLMARIQNDWEAARAAHGDRIDRCRRAWRAWRNRPEQADISDADASNYRDPLVQALTFAGWARDVGALLGDDADIEAVPTSPSDQRIVAKVSRFITWAVFSGMQAANELIVFLLFRRLYGRAIAFCPWTRDVFDTPEGPALWYEGPDFRTLFPDDIITPAEDARSIQDFTWVIHQERVSPEDLLDGEAEGRYERVSEYWATLQGWSYQAQQRDARNEELRIEKDEAEGVQYQNAQLSASTLLVHHWYGRWQPHTDPNTPPPGRPIEVVVHYIPGAQKILGVVPLMELYPKSRHRRPFVESALVRDGSYWGPGFGEMLEEEAAELTNNHNQFTDAGEFAACPPGFYDPQSQLGSKPLELAPRRLYPVTGGASGIGWASPKYDPNFHVLKDQAIRANVERKVGISDQSMGRSLDRPNAPRTATGQVALLQQGNERLNLDMEVLREDMSHVLRWIWELYCQFAPENLFFRVTEEDANGLFDSDRGFGSMTRQEFAGRYDFRLTFATNVWSRAARKEQQLALYQLDLNNPLVAQNPQALYAVTKRVHSALGDDQLGDILPEPAEVDRPRNPLEEWTMALQGEEIHVNPADPDDQHLIDHQRRISQEAQSQQPDTAAINEMAEHIVEHLQQKRSKAALQVMVDRMGQQAQAEIQGQPGPFDQQPGAVCPLAAQDPAGSTASTPPAGPVPAPQPDQPLIGALDPGQVPNGQGTL